MPVMKEQEGMTYYLCGQQHYVLAYGRDRPDLHASANPGASTAAAAPAPG